MTTPQVDPETGEIMQDEPNGRAVVAHPGVETGRDLERRQKVSGLLRPVAKPEDVLAAQAATRDLVAKALQADRDFGTIPGTRKPTLLKPGAERINAAFGVAPRYQIMEREVDHDREIHWTKRKWEWGDKRGEKVWSEETGVSQGLYRYVVECELVHRESGVVIGQGIGSCSTMESKYIDRPRECENVALKMAQKRALIAATLNAYGLSDQFTQDVEDLDLGGGSGAGSTGPFALSDTVGFGKHKGETWAKLVKDEPGYVKWAVENMEKLSGEAKKVLREALEGGGTDALAERRGKVLASIRKAKEAGAISEQEHERCKIDATGGEADDLDRVVQFLRDAAQRQNGADEDDGAEDEQGEGLFNELPGSQPAPSAVSEGQ